MTIRKAILHIGTMKTGTTSVQTALKINPRWLAQQGYSYLDWPLRTSELLEKRIRAVPSERNIIISDEGLWHFAFSGRSDTAAIAKCLADFKVTVLVYLRRPDEFLEAWFSQGLKSGTGGSRVADFLSSGFVQTGSAFKTRLDAFAALFGKEAIQVCPYEKKQMPQGDIVLDFLQKTGLAPVGSDYKSLTAAGFEAVATRSNVSPDPDALLLISIMRRFAPTDQVAIAEITASLVNAAKRAEQSSHKRLLQRDEVDLIIAQTRPELHKIQQDYGGGGGPDFFLDWPTPETPHEVCALRSIYDQIMVK